MPFGLSDNTLEQIRSVFLLHPEIERVILYGSRARGNYRNGSDIDLTFIGQDLTLLQLGKIDDELDDLLLPYMFDLSILEDISNPILVEQIEQVGALFYEKENH
jgi:predicted nucleotidyltransferase